MILHDIELRNINGYGDNIKATVITLYYKCLAQNHHLTKIQKWSNKQMLDSANKLLEEESTNLHSKGLLTILVRFQVQGQQ